MQERQVTIGGETARLPELFLVLATQNPIEHEGTYPLPEAQVDRFLFKLIVSYPERSEERAMLDRMTDGPPPEPRAVLDPARILRARQEVREVYVDGRIKEYVLELVAATRDPSAAGLDRLAPLIEFGVSPRGAIGLVQAAKALAFIAGRPYVLPEDIRTLAPDVLRHRIIPTYRAEAEGVTTDAMLNQVLATVAVP
jgi:MoxR-like ATPase